VTRPAFIGLIFGDEASLKADNAVGESRRSWLR
jgi:hypothetical protein